MDPLTISVFAKPAAQIATKLFKPLVEKLEKEIATNAKLAHHRIVGSYSTYLQNAFVRHSYFNSVVFKNEQRKLADYYQFLTLVQSRTEKEIKIDHYPKSLVDEIQNILIVDTAGMGKTTLLKYLFLNCINQEAGIPIFVELRKLSKKQSLLKFIMESLSDLEGALSKDLFFKLLASGEFVFFLDGYDEISESERQEVTSSMQHFMEKTRGNKFIMTSRDEVGLAAFSQFQRYTIRPLEQEEAFSLLRKYSGESELATKLIEKLEAPENRVIHEFLSNPLLTSLLFKSFEYKHVVPLKKHIFYRQVYESLYETHDLTKEGGAFQRTKRCGLDIDRFAKILRCLGAVTYKAEKVEFTKEEALSFISTAKKLAVEPKTPPSDILHDLTHAVPLLVPDGNYIRWSHRSIQEYFAAQYICECSREKRIEILLKHFNEQDASKHMNLLLLCADMDRPTFEQSVGSLIAEKLLDEFNESYLELDGLIDDLSLRKRKELIVGKHVFYIRNQELINTEFDGNKLTTYSRTLHGRMRASCQEELVSTKISHAVPSVGFAFNNFGQAVDVLTRSSNLPFIQHINHRFKPGREEILDESIEFLKISQDASNPANHPAAFPSITDMIERFCDWKFDPEIAANYLNKVKAELSAKQDVEPW